MGGEKDGSRPHIHYLEVPRLGGQAGQDSEGGVCSFPNESRLHNPPHHMVRRAIWRGRKLNTTHGLESVEDHGLENLRHFPPTHVV